MTNNVSSHVFYKLVDELIRNQERLPHGFSADQQHALSIYATERNRGAESRVFEYAHPDAYARIAGLVADYIPAARSVSEYAAQVSEAETDALRQIALQRGLHRLAEALDTEQPAPRKPDGL